MQPLSKRSLGLPPIRSLILVGLHLILLPIISFAATTSASTTSGNTGKPGSNPICTEYAALFTKLAGLSYSEYLASGFDQAGIEKLALVSETYNCELCPSGAAPGLASVRGISTEPILRPVCLENLGDYASGKKIGDNAALSGAGYTLRGKYVSVKVDAPSEGESEVVFPRNDFLSVNKDGAGVSSDAAAAIQLYFTINDYRKRVLSDGFISSLRLDSRRAQNLSSLQARSDFGDKAEGVPAGVVKLSDGLEATPYNPETGRFFAPTRFEWESEGGFDSFAYDPEFTVGEYSALAANWIAASPTPWQVDAEMSASNLNWRTDIRPAIISGFKLWNGYLYSGRAELRSYSSLVARRWAGAICGTATTPRCDRGRSIDNVMMYLDTANGIENSPQNPAWPSASTSNDTLLFPFRIRSGVPENYNGPKGGELAGMFIAGLFYDLSRDVGLGDEKASMIFWKTMSMIDPGAPISMSQFGALVQVAARELFPSTIRVGQSWYEADIVEALAARGIRVNGVTNFADNLAAPIGIPSNPGPGTLTAPSSAGFGSPIPESQRDSVTGYDWLSHFSSGYTVSTPGTQYVTYQFHKFSRYGHCDGLSLTNGTISALNSANATMDFNGSMAVKFTGRDLANTLVMAPGAAINFLRLRGSCSDENEAEYASDVRPFGFRVIKAIPNGFSFRVTRLGTLSNGRIRYQLTVVDPSVTMTGPNTGPATYDWSFTEFNDVRQDITGAQVIYSALRNQPVTITVSRRRGAQVDSISLRESGDSLDRRSGAQFSQDFVNPGYPVGFDTIVNRRTVTGRGSYNSALNLAGGAFGVQARRWTTPSDAAVKPLRFSTVTHGIGSGSNSGGPFRFQSAQYFNACIWSSRDSVVASPGCTHNPAAGSFEQRVALASISGSFSEPFASVTNSGVPAYLWTVNYPSDWRLEANREYHFGSHISASVSDNGYTYTVCSALYAPGTAGTATDRSDFLAGANWSGQQGAPPPQTMRSYLSSPGSVTNCTYAAYRFEGVSVPR